MSIKYVPILRWKRGEQQAIVQLNSKIRNQIMPLIEIPYTESARTKMKSSIDTILEDMPFYFYLAPEWYEDVDEGYYQQEAIQDKYLEVFISLENKNAVPVFDLSNIDYLKIPEEIKNKAIAIRIQNDEFFLIENIFPRLKLIPENTDIIIDLKHIDSDDLFSKISVIKAVMVDINRISDFRSIIISGGSFPQNLTSLQPNKIYTYPRREVDFYVKSKDLSEKFKFNYIYSDYGPSDLAPVEFVVGMVPNFKIRYTTNNEWLYIRGISIKKGGLDLNEVSSCCKTLVDSNYYSGQDYSWGDKKIYDIAFEKCNAGNLTSWVSYCFNHHITLISNQI